MKALAIILILLGLVISIPCVLNYMDLAKSLDESSVLAAKAQRMMNDPLSNYYQRREVNEALTELAGADGLVRARQREDIVYISIAVIMVLAGVIILTGQASGKKQSQLVGTDDPKQGP